MKRVKWITKHMISSMLIVILVVTSIAVCPIKAKAEGEVKLESPSAVLMEASTGKIIYDKKGDEERPLASVTKIMTMLLIFEAIEAGKISLEDKVSVSEHAASMGGSQVFLEPNETQDVNTMLKCISIASANDASVAMAEKIAGSEEEFVKRMNKKAEKLGMKHTHFLNCCGLDDDIESGHYSTAHDIAIMSRELITRFPQISDYATVWMDTITHVTRKGESEFGLTNTNKLIRTYDGITGLKTGSTSKAKFCLSATAKRNGMGMIAVIMAAPNPKTRFSEAAKLLDYGFANCSLYKDKKNSLNVKAVPVEQGIKEETEVYIKKPFSYVCLLGENKDKIAKKEIIKKHIPAPVKKGDKVGEIKYTMKGKEIGSVPILAKNNVPKAKYKDYLFKVLNTFFMNEPNDKEQ